MSEDRDPRVAMYHEQLKGVSKENSKFANTHPELGAAWDRIAKEMSEPPEGLVSWDTPADGLTDGEDEDAGTGESRST